MALKASYINQYFDHVYVLNLEHRPDRKIAMLQKLSRLGIQAEFVQAINGYSYQNQLEYKGYLDIPIGGSGSHPLELSHQRKLISSPGAWGYLKTYHAILTDARKRGFERILCFDDDVLFHKDFENQFKKSALSIPEDWKLLYLGASQYSWKVPQSLSYPDEKKKEWDKNANFYFPKKTDGSFAIGIHSSVFDLLLQAILRMDCPLDSGPLRDVIEYYPKDCYVLFPNIVIADVSESDIREGQDQRELGEELKWDVDGYEYPAQLDLVSIIMPAYNAEKSIEKSIRSILLQSYASLELIVVDDASTDHTTNIVRRLMKEDPRIQLVELENNTGVGGARNAGIKASKGDLIAFQDADDISLRHRLAYQLIPIYEQGVMFSVCRFYRSRCTMEELDIHKQEDTLSLVESRRVQSKNGKYAYRDRAEVGLATTVYRRSIFKKYGLFLEQRFGEDMEMLERILFYKLNRRFDEKYNGHSFLNDHQSISNTMKRIEKVLYISPDMDENNLTIQYQKKSNEKREIERGFRNNFVKSSLDQYPKLGHKENEVSAIQTKFNTLVLDTFIVIPDVEYQLMKSQILDAKRTEKRYPPIDELYNSISWKITAPIRWVVDGIKSLFR